MIDDILSYGYPSIQQKFNPLNNYRPVQVIEDKHYEPYAEFTFEYKIDADKAIKEFNMKEYQINNFNNRYTGTKVSDKNYSFMVVFRYKDIKSIT